ncbi:MAG TPA: hypothetical protein ENI97_12905 [Gammaproteobacteria bacterium]|nr:hypothetical protein [Gammaproteobacteria bacterium]
MARIPTNQRHILWAAYLASLLTLLVIAAQPPVEISLLATSGTLLLWIWLARKHQLCIDRETPYLSPEHPHLLHSARQAAGTRLQENIQQSFTPANASLEQITGIIDDGTQKLQQSFANIASKSTRQLEQLHTLLHRLENDSVENNDESIEHLVHTTQEIHRDISSAITAMQFEDATTQIALYLKEQLKIMQASMEIVQQELRTDSDMLQCLQQIEQRLQNQQAKRPRQTVSAKDMQEGEIDLF